MRNCYEDVTRADSYARLAFANTYHLAFRDLPAIFREHVTGTRAMDFGCGTGRSTRFLRALGFDTTGVDISAEMIAKARELDTGGDYRLVGQDGPVAFPAETFDLVLCAFPFDNIPGFETKVALFRALRRLLATDGCIVNIVSSPELYTHEWASFSTKDFPENRNARPGDIVRVITTDFADRRPAEDIFWPDESYREVYETAGLSVAASHRPLATGDEPYEWVSETTLPPWIITVLKR